MKESRLQPPKTLTETIEFQLIREMLGPHGKHAWRVERTIPLPAAAGSEIWELSCKPANGETLKARVQVGPDGIRPDHAPKPQEPPDKMHRWVGRDLLWEGQPDIDFSRSVTARSGFQLDEARDAFANLKPELERQNLGEVSPRPGAPRMPSTKRRIFPSADPNDRARAQEFFTALEREFRGFDGAHGEEAEEWNRSATRSPISVEAIALPFYSEDSREVHHSSLVEVTDRRSGRPRQTRFVWGTNKPEKAIEPGRTLYLWQLDGLSRTIQAINRALDLHLGSSHVADYVRFASSSLHGEAAQAGAGREYPAFQIIEHVGALKWYPESEEVRRLVGEHLAPIQVKSATDPGDGTLPYLAGAFVFFSGALFFSVFEVDRQTGRNWDFLMRMTADFALFSNLPARPTVDSVGNCVLLQPRKKSAP